MVGATRLSQQERRASTRAALVEAAAALFAEHGYDAVSVDAVAEAAGRTSGAVYDHFASKQGLLLAVLDDGAHALVSLLSQEMESAPTLRDRLRAVSSEVIVRPSQKTRRLLMLEHEFVLRAQRDQGVADAVRARNRQARQRLAAGIARWVADGVLAADGTSPEELAARIQTLVLGMELQQRLDASTFDVERATAILEAALSPVGSPLPASRR
jgi:AcrR family transcriptional regulator